MYYSLNQKLKEQFGCKVYKIALDGGFTCPNRDGKIGSGGCIFCLDGSGSFSEKRENDISLQIEKAKERVKSKNKSGKYIAYYQSYTNTYAEPCYLEKIFTKTLESDDIVALSIATRPDCLEKPVLEVLEKLAKIKPLFVELGLQSIKPETVEYIRRGYPNEVYQKAVSDLHKIGAEVVTHVILGLPGETKQDMLETVKFAVGNKTDGIKLQLLHVLEGTDLAKDYFLGKFKTLEMDEYIDILCDCIEILPENVVVHRLTGDGDKKHLIAPLWSGDKKRVLNQINKTFAERNIKQKEL